MVVDLAFGVVDRAVDYQVVVHIYVQRDGVDLVVGAVVVMFV